jgi:hypothetical protein
MYNTQGAERPVYVPTQSGQKLGTGCGSLLEVKYKKLEH